MAEVGAMDADGFTIGQHSHEAPVHLCVAKAGPAVRARLVHELLPSPSTGRGEQGFASVRVVEGDLTLPLGQALLQEGRSLKVAGLLGSVPVEVADGVCQLVGGAPAQVVLHRRGGGAVALRTHDVLISHDDRRPERHVQGGAERSARVASFRITLGVLHHLADALGYLLQLLQLLLLCCCCSGRLRSKIRLLTLRHAKFRALAQELLATAAGRRRARALAPTLMGAASKLCTRLNRWQRRRQVDCAGQHRSTRLRSGS
mmetsp:Transcript_87728/g.237622  ORF Transcript_87728/g.237622 Transcript_87728/m.237622 type:complete len:259 (+) Transcript_87728:303-1079(+)